MASPEQGSSAPPSRTDTGMAKRFAFVDESGDPSLTLGTQGVSDFYIVCAVLVGENEQEASSAADAVRHKHFADAEMKSSAVGDKARRREQILKDIREMVGAPFYAFVADKRQIDPDSGLRFRQSFVKYLNGRLYAQLYRSFSHLVVRADRHGRSEFMESFQRYLRSKYQSQLFDRVDFAFVQSKAWPLVQVADMIAGTLRRVYEERDTRDLLGELSPIAILIEHWPPSVTYPDVLSGMETPQRYNQLVAQQSINLARGFLQTNANDDDPEVKAQLATVRFLLYKFELTPSGYVHAGEILDHLNVVLGQEIERRAFYSGVVAKLRSAGVIIASSPAGYKIASTLGDMHSYVSKVNTLTIPYLRRLASARSHLFLASLGECDVVRSTCHPELAACLNALGSPTRPMSSDSH